MKDLIKQIRDSRPLPVQQPKKEACSPDTPRRLVALEQLQLGIGRMHGHALEDAPAENADEADGNGCNGKCDGSCCQRDRQHPGFL